MLFKRTVDISISMLALVLLLPVFLIIAAAIKLSSPGPVFYVQQRAGRFAKAFDMIKFRSMVIGAEKKEAGVFVEDNDPRITRVGRFLRTYSFDELPQLINVLKGEMSLVGPRPTLPYQVERYDECQKRRLDMKPGITGWAQINGRNALTWPEKIDLDLWYIDNWSFWLDIKIIFRTFFVVLHKENLNTGPTGDEISNPGINGNNGLPM